jgi:hypothetical protein
MTWCLPLDQIDQQNFNAGLDHAGADAGQPTAFFVGGAPAYSPGQRPGNKNLQRKVRSKWFLTQPVATASCQAFLQRYQSNWVPTVPVLVGVLPLVACATPPFTQ